MVMVQDEGVRRNYNDPRACGWWFLHSFFLLASPWRSYAAYLVDGRWCYILAIPSFDLTDRVVYAYSKWWKGAVHGRAGEVVVVM